jgi:hypothetical protein
MLRTVRIARSAGRSTTSFSSSSLANSSSAERCDEDVPNFAMSVRQFVLPLHRQAWRFPRCTLWDLSWRHQKRGVAWPFDGRQAEFFTHAELGDHGSAANPRGRAATRKLRAPNRRNRGDVVLGEAAIFSKTKTHTVYDFRRAEQRPTPRWGEIA